MADPMQGFTNSGSLDTSATSRSGSVYGAPVTVGGITFPPKKSTAIYWAALIACVVLAAVVIHLKLGK